MAGWGIASLGGIGLVLLVLWIRYEVGLWREMRAIGVVHVQGYCRLEQPGRFLGIAVGRMFGFAAAVGLLACLVW